MNSPRSVMPLSISRHGERGTASSWRGCLRIADEEPGLRLRLVWRGCPPHFLVRNGLTLFILLFLIAFLTIVAVVTYSKLPPGWMRRIDLLGPAVTVLGIFSGVGLFVSRQWFRSISSHFGYWRSFEWNRERGDFRAEYCGSFVGGGRRVAIALNSIRGITAVLPAKPRGRQPIEIQFSLRNATGQHQTCGITQECLHWEIEHVGSQPEAIDLLFRMARVIGLDCYIIQESTRRALKLKLLRLPINTKDSDTPEFADDDVVTGKLFPIPKTDCATEYALNSDSFPVAERQISAPPFSPKQLRGQVESTQLTVWEPGRRIHLLRPGLPAVVWRVLGLIGALAGGICGGFLLAPILPYAGWLTCLVAALVGGIGTLCTTAWIFREREVIFDWSNGTLWWRESRWQRTLPFEDITSCVLRGTMVTKTVNKHTSLAYRTDVWLETADRRVLIIGTDGSTGDPDKPYHGLVSLTADLATALRVPWRWEEYTSRAARLGNIFRGTE